MNESLLVSMIVPIYNVEKYLDACVKSLVEQTYRNIEILLVDDGSRDSSGEISDEWEKVDSRIRVFHKENGGVSAARNLALQHAKGEYVFFVDSDDYIASDYVEKMIAAMEKENADMSMCKYYNVWQNMQRVEGRLPNKEMVLSVEQYLEGLYVYSGHYSLMCNKAFKRELFDGVEFAIGKRNEDARIMLQLVLKANKVVHVAKPLYYYRQRQTSFTKSENREVMLSSETEWIRLHIEKLEQKGMVRLHMLALKLYFNKIAESFAFLSKHASGEYKKEIRKIGKKLLKSSLFSARVKIKIALCMYFTKSYSRYFNRNAKKSHYMCFQ